MQILRRFLPKLLSIVIFGIVVNSVIYLNFFPSLFPGYKTYTVFICVFVIATLSGGCVCIHALPDRVSSSTRILVAALIGISVAILATLGSLLIILNIVGA
jgi:hypothetical protein